MELFLHIGNVLYVISYSVRDILALRVITIVAILSLCAFYFSQALYVAIVWSAVFTLVNLVQVYRLLLERRPVKLTVEERRLYGLAFRGVDERHFKRLAGIGAWETVAHGTEFISEGEAVDRVRIVLEGDATVFVAGVQRGQVGPGQFVGEGAFLTGEPATASVYAVAQLRVLSLPSSELRTLLERRPEIRSSLQRLISADLVSKLRGGPRLTTAPA